jgi:hypothetical protein
MESAGSIRSLYRHFFAGNTKKNLNAFYYACSYAKADDSKFMNITAAVNLSVYFFHEDTGTAVIFHLNHFGLLL